MAASNSILKLQVDDKQYEASIKSAQNGMQALMNTLRQSGKTFNDVDKQTEQYVRELGKMETKATTTRGRIGEMTSAFVELSHVEKQLTDQERQSPVGKALTESLEQLKKRTIDAKNELENLNNELNGAGKTSGGGLFGGGKLDGMLQVFGGNLMTKGAGMLAGLASEMADMVKQGVELAKQGEGIRNAFERLGRGDILDGLRQATHGTVTDIELMKAAVKFNDFKLPLEELGTMLAFAQQKAKDTGQSVDYMVDSIVTGLGRKSLMILDNLGLSAAEIKDKMAETGDMTKAVGAIIREQMAKAGDYVETAADRAAQANVSLQNKMEELGRKFAPVEEASNQLWTSMKIGILDIIGGPLARLLNGLTEAGRLKNMLNDLNGDDGSGNTKVGQQLKKLQVIKKAGGSNYIFNSTLSGMLEDYNRQIMALDAQIKNGGKKPGAGPGESQDVRYLQQQMKALGMMRDQLAAGAKDIMKPVNVNVNTKGAEQNVESLKLKLVELEAQRKKAIAAGDTDLSKNLAKQINQVKADIKGLGGTTTNTHKNLDAEQQVQKKINDLLKDALTADSDRQGEIRQQVAELQKQQEKYKDIKNLALGILPKDKEAVFTIDGQLSEETKKALSDIKGVTIDDKTMTVTADTQEAMQKVQELIGQVSTTTLQMKVKTDGAPTFTMAQLEGMSFDNQIPTTRGNRGKAQDKLDLATAAFATGGTSDIDFSNYISGIKNALSNANLGDELYTSMTESLKDATTVSTLLQEMMERGLAGADLESTAQALKEKLLSPEGIDQTAVQSFLDELNKQIEEAGGVGLKLNADTGEVTDDKGKDKGEELKKFNDGIGKLSGGLSQVTGGLKSIGIELPKEVDQVIGVINGVSQVISGVGTIISVFQTSAITANTIALGALTSAVTANTFAKFIPFLSGGGVVPAFAQGGTIPKFADGGLIGRAAGGMMIPGNSMSGDRLRMPVDGGRGMIGVNSGELILNKSSQNSLAADLLQAESLVDSIRDYRVSLDNAQQGVIAGALEGGGLQNLKIDWVLKGDALYAVMNNNGRRTGRGEVVQRNRI